MQTKTIKLIPSAIGHFNGGDGWVNHGGNSFLDSINDTPETPDDDLSYIEANGKCDTSVTINNNDNDDNDPVYQYYSNSKLSLKFNRPDFNGIIKRISLKIRYNMRNSDTFFNYVLIGLYKISSNTIFKWDIISISSTSWCNISKTYYYNFDSSDVWKLDDLNNIEFVIANNGTMDKKQTFVDDMANRITQVYLEIEYYPNTLNTKILAYGQGNSVPGLSYCPLQRYKLRNPPYYSCTPSNSCVPYLNSGESLGCYAANSKCGSSKLNSVFYMRFDVTKIQDIAFIYCRASGQIDRETQYNRTGGAFALEFIDQNNNGSGLNYINFNRDATITPIFQGFYVNPFTLTSWKTTDFYGVKIGIVVVANDNAGSPPNPKSLISNFKLQIVYKPKRGASAALLYLQ